MADTQPKKRTRIENFTPSVAKQMILEKKSKGCRQVWSDCNYAGTHP